MSRRFVVVLAAGAVAMIPALAQAQIIVEAPARGLPYTFVRYGDLNLAHPAGVAELYGRVHRAAETLCDDYRVRDIGRAMAGSDCMAFAMGNARISMNRAIAFHRSRQQFASRGW